MKLRHDSFHRVLKTGRNLAAVFSCLILISCAGAKLEKPVEKAPEVVQETEQTDTSETDSYIALEPGIEEDFNHAIILMESGEYEIAIATLESVIEREQRLVAPFINIAIAYRKAGDNEQAEQNLNKAVTIEPENPIANNELGLVYRKAGKFADARAAYEKAIDIDPEFAAAKRNLAVLCDLYLHDFDCAMEQFASYLELVPDDEEVPIWIADLKRRLGK
jgi:tetratricopeptide (TPR) repeat protein